MHDAIVVGAGAAGGWAAKELCERGLDVLLLDAGPKLRFPEPAPDDQRLLSRARGLRRQPIQARCAAYNGRTRQFFVDDRDNPYTTPAGRPFNWFRGRQVGGRLPLWARVVPRLTERELDGWPLTAGELAPYYARVEDFLQVASPEPTAAEARLEDAVARAFPAAETPRPRIAAYDRGPLPATIRTALATGKLELRPDAVVRTVATDATGRATGVRYVDRVERREIEAYGRAVVLCASTIETLRILLASRLGTTSGLLGRGLMDHVLTFLGGPLDEAEPTGAEGSYDVGAVTGFQIRLGNYAVQGAAGRGAPVWYFLAHGEMRSRPENRVTLHPGRTDAWGMPVAGIECAHGPAEAALAAEQLRTMRELAAAAGFAARTTPSGKRLEAAAYRLWSRRLMTSAGAFVPGTAAHEIGGAPMGSDARHSVVDRFNRLWDADNVVVADGAAFPRGCWQNVTLTIMALAVRAADHLADELEARRV